MPDLKKALKDFVATSNSGKYKDETELLSKFPELKGYDTKSLKDYVATSNSGKYKSEDELNSKFPELFTEKKKDNSVSSTTSPKLASEGTVGSSGGVKSSTFTEQIKQPSISKNEYKTIDGKIKTLKPTPAVSKNLEVANTAFNYAKQNVNKELSLERLNDEVDNNQWTDKISQGFKDAYNRTVAAPLTVVNTLLGGNKNFYAKKYVPLEREKKQALQDLKKEKKSDENVLITDEAVNARAKQLFIEKDTQEQMSQLVDEALPSGYDREGVWKELKLEGLRSNDALRSAVASAEVYKAQIKELDLFYKNLTPEEKKNGVSGDRFNELEIVREKAKTASEGLQYLSKNFDNYLAKANTDQEKLELFKYNYNDFDKVTSLLKNSTKNIVGGTVKLASEGAKFMAKNINQEEMNKPLNALSEIGSELMNEAEKDNAQFYRYKASSINNWSDFGSFASQLGAEQIPILASIYLGGTPGLIAVSASSGGQKINQLEEDAKKPFGRVYSDGEKLLAGLLYAGAEYFPEKFGTARILKDLEKTVSAASTASRRMFTESFLKTTYKGLGKTAYNVGLEAGTELITAEGQITIDQELLGVVRTQAEKNEMRFESGVSGGLMGGGMTMTGGLIGLGVTQSKLYSDKKDIAEVQKLFSQINAINDEIENNENLTEAERNELYEETNKLNYKAFSIVEKNAKKGIELPIEAKSYLVDVNQQQLDLKAKAVEVSSSNFSPEIKKAKLNALENEFNSLEEKRQSVLEGNTTAVDFLPLNEQETIKKEALQSLTAELNPDGTKDITITNEQIVKRANELLKKPTNTEPTPVLTEEQRTKELADFLNELDPDEQVEVQEELNNSPTVKESIDSDTTFTMNGEEGFIKIEGQQVVFETPNTVHELGNVDEISDSKLLEYGIEPTQELDIEVSDDYSVQMDGKTYQNPNENPSDAVVVGKNGEYSINLVNDKGQKRTIRGQRAEQIAYNYKLKELENGTDQQIEQAIADAETAINDEATAVSEANGNPEQANKKRRAKKQRSLKQAKEPLTKAESEEIELNRLIAEEELAKTKTTEDEAAPKNDTPANGNIQPRTKPVGESVVTKPKSPAKESVQKPADGGAVEKGAEVTTKKVRSVKNADFDVDIDANGRVKEIRSTKNGRVISKFKEIKVKPTTENPSGKRLAKNANWYKIEADALGKKTKNQEDDIAKAERKVEDAKINEIVPFDEYSAALKYVAQGGKVKLDSARKETGERNSKAMKWAAGFNKESGLKSIERVAEDIASKNENLNESEIRDALIEVFSTFGNVDDVRKAFLDSYAENQAEFDRKELEYQIGQLSEEDRERYFAMQDSLAEDAYFEELSDEELNEYFQQKYDEYEQGQAEFARQETANKGREGVAESDSRQQQSKEKEVTKMYEIDGKSEFYHASQHKRFGRLTKNNAPQFGTGVYFSTNKELVEDEYGSNNTTKVKLNLKNPVIVGSEKWAEVEALAISNADTDYGNKKGLTLAEDETYFRYDKENLSELSEIPSSFISNAAIELGYDAIIDEGSSQYENEIVVLDETVIIYEEDQKSFFDITLDQLNQWENDLDQFGRENLSMGIPLVVAKGAIQAMKAALKAGKLATEVLQAGLDYVRQTEWFKKLSQTEQSNIESDFQANFLNQINAIDPKNDRQAENLLNRAASESISEEDAYNEVNDAFDRSNEALENKKPFREAMKNLYRSYVKKFTDRQFSAKMLLGKSGLTNTKNLMINAHGASGLAKMKFQEAYDKIYKGLNAKNRLTLDKIIQARRFIAIDTNREARGLEPVTHPSFIDKNKSEKFLSRLETEIGSEAFADLNKRAEAYFDTYKTLLDEMLDNGLISQESYDSMQDVDYQPRVFLQFVTDFNGDLGEGNKQNNLDSGGLSADQIKSMKEGDASDLVLKSEWLLTNSLLARSRAMAVNNINKRFMTDEFPKAKARFDALDPKNLKGDDIRFYKYFKELQSKIIDNPVQGLSKSGKPKYKYDKTPLNFQKAYYYIDGKQHQFFIEKELHEAWFDNVEGIMGSKTKEFLSYASGSALVKGIATGNNPAFPIVNTPRDFLFTITFSDQYSSFIPKAMGQIAKDVAKSIKEIRKSDSDVLQKYMEYGGAMDFLSSQGKLKKNSVVGKVLQKAIDPKARDTFKKVFDAVTLHKISQYSEMMFRLGIFQRSINNQLKELGYTDMSEISDKQQVDDIYNQAVANARGILDFNQGGSVTKDLESVIPYINVAFQGGRVAASAFEKNPTQTTAKILQVATIASSIPVGISLALLSMIKPDDDKDKSSYEIYLHAMEGVSAYQKSKYMNFVLPFKNEDGEYMIVKIAKAQELSPIMSVTDDIYNNMIRSLAGKDKKSAERILDDAAFTFNSNVMPIDFTSPAGLITRTPAVKAVLTYQTGYDFFRDEPLSNDIGKVPLPVEGANMRSTEDFYKKIGENFGLSPIRTKAFVESMITSPSTNPFVGMLYGGADAASSDKDMKQIGKEFATTLGKSTLKRVIGYSTEFNRQLATNDKLQDDIDNINIEKYKMKAKFSDLTKQFIAKEITEKELVEEVLKLDPNDQKSMVNRIKDKIRLQDVDGSIIDIKYEQGSEAKALMIMHYYGDITDGSEDSKQVILQMKRAKGVLTESVIFEYEKLLKQLKSTKKRPD